MKLQHRDFLNTYCPPKLFGDYELLIDLALDGDKEIKTRVARADQLNRGGLKVLQNAIKNRKITLRGALADTLASCIADQEFWETKQNDRNRIYERPNGKFQVQITVEHNCFIKTFDELADAQEYRDRMLLLSFAMKCEDKGPRGRG